MGIPLKIRVPDGAIPRWKAASVAAGYDSMRQWIIDTLDSEVEAQATMDDVYTAARRDADEQSPFGLPPVTSGYPLEPAERAGLERLTGAAAEARRAAHHDRRRRD